MIELIFKLYVSQIIYFLLGLTFLVFIFEILPIFYGVKSSIRKNTRDFFLYQTLRGIFSIMLGTTFLIMFKVFRVDYGFIDIHQLPLFLQVIILYLCSEFIIYVFHFMSHKYKLPALSKAHKFHHTITTDLEWVNSRKEHLLVISVFVFVFCLFFYVIFESSSLANFTVLSVFLLLLSFSHYRLPLSIPYLDKIFLFPKDHLRHHTSWGGPYGVTLSLFDTIFGTREKVKKFKQD